MSSDAATLGSGNLALITYWEVRTSGNLDVYRCIDTVSPRFSPINQQCWSALRPTGRGPAIVERALSSTDLCGRPDDLGGISGAAYCSFSDSTMIRTPFFSLMISPFGNESLVAVGDGGRSLIVTGQPWPSTEFFEVRATDKASRGIPAELSTTSATELLQEGATVCEARRIAGRDWTACQSNGSDSITHYLVERDTLYEVSFRIENSASVRQTIDAMFSSLGIGRREQP